MLPEPAIRSSLTRFAWLSIAAAVATILLKSGAFLLTGSVGLLSDAMESLVNLMGGVMALAMLTIAARPADEDHAFGHGKAEYFSSGLEGLLILAAAAGIMAAAIPRLFSPKPLEQIGLGLVVLLAASLINLVVALVLGKAGREHGSITLEASSHHLMTDVWTSVGVLVGVGAVALTGWQRLDPIVAILVAGNIVWTGFGIVRKSIMGLMDSALSMPDQMKIRDVLDTYASNEIQYHELRTRQSGSVQYVSLHVLVPDDWTVLRGHQLLELIEGDIRRALPTATILTHLEPLSDLRTWDDVDLDRMRRLPERAGR